MLDVVVGFAVAVEREGGGERERERANCGEKKGY